MGLILRVAPAIHLGHSVLGSGQSAVDFGICCGDKQLKDDLLATQPALRGLAVLCLAAVEVLVLLQHECLLTRTA